MKLRIAIALLAVSLAQIISASTLTNDSIVKMVGAGIDDDTIILAINNGDNSFDTSSDALVSLKQAGVPDKIIKKMISPSAPSSSAQRSASSSSSSSQINIELPPTITPAIGGEYYLRYTLRYEKKAYSTTNYARGSVLSINARVKIIDLTSDILKFQIVDTGEVIKVKNEVEFTGKDMRGMAEIMFADQPTEIEKFSDDISKSISAGEIRIGMTKQQVILTRGYPPVHKTPSTDGCDTWVYWSSRFAVVSVVFRGGVVVEGRGLR